MVIPHFGWQRSGATLSLCPSWLIEGSARIRRIMWVVNAAMSVCALRDSITCLISILYCDFYGYASINLIYMFYCALCIMQGWWYASYLGSHGGSLGGCLSPGWSRGRQDSDGQGEWIVLIRPRLKCVISLWGSWQSMCMLLIWNNRYFRNFVCYFSF
jgi:hypothetical protein